ncbi:homoprotocatechuate degradation operon regulator, HpaR [Variovorax sp. SRS16]|uniref:MarR family winged helix-turn-helix transcriptional regulator n=1 Tax=Variovorax sp. SRS16 TaxID=282217 RepID=UPI001318C890|nr:MarR family transcriptional regulator [Variovorax sp. SRS16]VTU12836.1 homoprotocatechuate degradation operon regulator, HpaR [Variovorax sp. SRS16]
MKDNISGERSHPSPSPGAIDPWSRLNDAGDDLTVDNFITTVMSQTVNALRRVTTLPYARRFGLTVPEWRILALLAHAHAIPFSKLVVQSTSDKALVSRTLRLLEQRGLVALEAEGPAPRKRLVCTITPAGEALHAQVIPVARQAQASMINLLTPEERRVMFTALKRIHRRCLDVGAPDGEDGEG